MSDFYRICRKVTFSDDIEIFEVDSCNDDRYDVWRKSVLPRLHRVLDIMFKARLSKNTTRYFVLKNNLSNYPAYIKMTGQLNISTNYEISNTSGR